MRVESGTPLLVASAPLETTLLDRVRTTDRSVNEDWIQQLIFDHPSALPLLEIDESFAPAIPIGREVATKAGPIDVLYISPSGGLTLVEAKLWRNPQARREVVGQVIDYATALALWGYEDLDDVALSLTGQRLWNLVGSHDLCPFESEEDFVDAVSLNLAQGRFLLTVVGDGIRHEVERMAAYVQAAPQLRFALALVELRLFDIPGESRRLVVPSVVMRTTEVTRAVVEVNVGEAGDVQVEVAVPAGDTATSRRQLTAEQFFDELANNSSAATADFALSVMHDFEAEKGFRIHWASASFVIKYDNPSGGNQLTILVITRDNKAYTGWLDQQLPRYGYDRQLGDDFVRDLARVVGVSVHPDNASVLAKAFNLETFQERYDEIKDLILGFTARLDLVPGE